MNSQNYPLLTILKSTSGCMQETSQPIFCWLDTYYEKGKNGKFEKSSTKYKKVCNFTQVFRTTFSGPSYKNALLKNYSEQSLKTQCKEEHFTSIEKYFWIGIKQEDKEHAYRETQGIFKFLEENYRITEKDNLKHLLIEAFTCGNKEKLLFTGKNNLQKIIEEGKKLSLFKNIKNKSIKGIKTKICKTPYDGSLTMIEHPLFPEKFSSYVVILDTDSLVYRFFKGRNTQFIIKERITIDFPILYPRYYQTECGLMFWKSPNCFATKKLNK